MIWSSYMVSTDGMLMNFYVPLDDKIRLIAKGLHDGHFRRDGVTPYFDHLETTVDILLRRGYVLLNQDVVDTAWLHDSVEDERTTFEGLRILGVNETVIEAVRVLTKVKGVSYAEYLAEVKANPIARVVKIADMLANLSDNPTDRQIKKYAFGLQFLLE